MFLKLKVYTNVEMGFIFLKIKTGPVVYLKELFTSLILCQEIGRMEPMMEGRDRRIPFELIHSVLV